MLNAPNGAGGVHTRTLAPFCACSTTATLRTVDHKIVETARDAA